MMRKLALLSSVLMLASCEVGPDFLHPHFDLPADWTQADDGVATAAPSQPPSIPLNWWTLFKDDKLNALEEEGIKNNADIALAAARVAEARGILRISDAALYPGLTVQTGGTRESRSREARFGGFATPSSKPYNDFTLSAVLDYEIDLWGKIRRADEASEAQFLAEQHNHDAVQLAVASDIATGYFNLLALNDQLVITKQTIASRQDSFGYNKKQFDAGQIDVLSFRRTEADLAVAEAALPQLQQQYEEQEKALAVLLGRSPNEVIAMPVAIGKLNGMPVPPMLPLDAPSTLLERRPDVARAEQAYVAANAEIGVALANYYPTLSLSALLGLESAKIDRLLRGSAKTWNFGAASVAPVIDSGTIGGNVDASKARAEQAKITYEQTVRQAFSDVATSLTNIRNADLRAAAEMRQVKANKETTRAAQLRFNAGYATQLDLLDAQRQLFQAQLDSVNAQQQRLVSTVTLYKALGGGWNDPKPTTKPVENAAPASAAKPEAPTTVPADENRS